MQTAEHWSAEDRNLAHRGAWSARGPTASVEGPGAVAREGFCIQIGFCRLTGVGPKGNLELMAEDEVLKSQVAPGPEQ
jgi:hypothetical protein